MKKNKFFFLIFLPFFFTFIQSLITNIHIDEYKIWTKLLLVNIFIFLFLILISVVILNFVKLFKEKKQKVLGINFKTKLISLFLLISIIPNIIIFIFSSFVVSKTMNIWVNDEIKKSLEDSLNTINYIYKDKEISKIDADKIYKLQLSLQNYKKIELIRYPLKITIMLSFIILTFLLTNLAIWASFLFVKKITSPIQALIKGTEEVANENLNYQIHFKGKDEFDLLIKSFNKMIEDLKKHKQELISTQKIATWKEMAQELAHEIKNPLTPIKLCAERLEKTYKENSKQYEEILKESTNTIIQETENLESLINEFSEFARIPNPIFKKINVNEIMDTILELYSHLSPQIKIKTKLDEKSLLILGDFDQLKRVFINLVKNAMESLSSSSEGEIKIKTFQNNSDVQIEIQDNGCGISEKIKDKIFYPHFSSKKKGMGLGLAIVHRIITEHNGFILIESKENQGTTVKIRLPYQAV